MKDGSGGIWIIRISYNLLKGLKGTVSVISNGPCISNRVACPILNENRWTSICWTKCENFFLTNIETTIKNNWIFEIRSRIACYFITRHAWKITSAVFFNLNSIRIFVGLLHAYCQITRLVLVSWNIFLQPISHISIHSKILWNVVLKFI